MSGRGGTICCTRSLRWGRSWSGAAHSCASSVSHLWRNQVFRGGMAMQAEQEVSKIGLDDFLVQRGREALTECEQVPLSDPIFAEARQRGKRGPARMASVTPEPA